jgi:hypothetical protein
MPQVARTPAGAAEDLAVGDQTASNAAQATEVCRDGVRWQAKLASDGMQSGQLALVGDPDVNTLDAEFVECRADLRAKWEVVPLRTLRETHRGSIRGYKAWDTNLDGNQVLVGRQSIELGTQLAVKRGEAGIRSGAAEICRHAVPPQVASAKGRGGKFEAVKADAYAEDTPWLAVEVDRTSRSTGACAANRVELHNDPARSKFANEIGHGGNAEAAAVCNVVTAASSVVAHVAKNLGEISLP